MSGWLPFKLRHQWQHDIQCLEWQPLSGTGLAVGCSDGVCFWRLVENGTVSEASESNNTNTVRRGGGIGSTHAWCEFLRCEGHAPVNTLSWSPDGRLLATGSVSSDHILIWDVALGTSTPIVAVNSCGVSLVRWAPSGHYLFAATLSKVVRVWETKTWTGERWTIPTGPCQSACWNPTGTLLLAAVAGSSELWTFAFHHKPPEIFGTLADLRLDVGHIWGEHVSDDDEEEEEVVVAEGGRAGASRVGARRKFCIREVAWSKDPFGARLAVTVNVRGGHIRKGKERRERRQNVEGGMEGGMEGGVEAGVEGGVGEEGEEGEDEIPEEKIEPNPSMVHLRDGEELILIYSVQIQPSLRFTPRGFLRGPGNGVKPYHLHFWEACDTGALLSACWLNGEVTMHPLLYDTKRHQYSSLDGRDEGDDFDTTFDEFDDDVAMDLERRDVHNQQRAFRRDW